VLGAVPALVVFKVVLEAVEDSSQLLQCFPSSNATNFRSA
jgi:hypothetical protein